MPADSLGNFLQPPVQQEVFPLQILDETGTVVEGLLKTLTKSLRYGVSRADFESLAQAIASRREDSVLKAVSAILNKDPDNIVAINSLAFFYLQNRRYGLAALILNRVSSKKFNISVIMNNLAVISLRYGNPREAVTYLKKALSANRSHHIARVNLANIFIQQYDYRNGYRYYKDSYSVAAKKWPSRNKKAVSILNNYGVALTGIKQWNSGLSVFKSLSSSPSPMSEVLFNYAVFLTEKKPKRGKRGGQSQPYAGQRAGG